MSRDDIRRLMEYVFRVVILFTLAGLVLQHDAFVRGLWLAVMWQGASVWCLAMCARYMAPPYTRRRLWALAGVFCIKFPALYWVGYLALNHITPSPMGMAVGLTLPWALLVLRALRTVVRDATRPEAI